MNLHWTPIMLKVLAKRQMEPNRNLGKFLNFSFDIKLSKELPVHLLILKFLLCWDMTNPQFPSRRFMIMKWSCLTGYQNFMESRPPPFSRHSLISVQVQHQKTEAAITLQAVWVLLTDTWQCALVWKAGVTHNTHHLYINDAEGKLCTVGQKPLDCLLSQITRFFVFLTDRYFFL